MMSFPDIPTPKPSPSAFKCKYGCGTWLYWSNVKSPKGVPLPLSTETRQYHECDLAPWRLEKKARLRAVAYKKGAIRNIDDFALIDKAQLEVAHINNRLAYHSLRLEVKQTQPLPEEGGE